MLQFAAVQLYDNSKLFSLCNALLLHSCSRPFEYRMNVAPQINRGGSSKKYNYSGCCLPLTVCNI